MHPRRGRSSRRRRKPLGGVSSGLAVQRVQVADGGGHDVAVDPHRAAEPGRWWQTSGAAAAARRSVGRRGRPAGCPGRAGGGRPVRRSAGRTASRPRARGRPPWPRGCDRRRRGARRGRRSRRAARASGRAVRPGWRAHPPRWEAARPVDGGRRRASPVRAAPGARSAGIRDQPASRPARGSPAARGQRQLVAQYSGSSRATSVARPEGEPFRAREDAYSSSALRMATWGSGWAASPIGPMAIARASGVAVAAGTYTTVTNSVDASLTTGSMPTVGRDGMISRGGVGRGRPDR